MTTVLTTVQRSELEAGLRARLQQLDAQWTAQQGGRSRAESAADDLAQDGDDAPQRDADRDIELARADRQLVEIGWLSRALQRVHDADFGLCAGCGQPIAYARLKVEPWAESCVACAAAREDSTAGSRRI